MGKPPRKNASPAPVSGAPGGKNIPLIVAVIAVAAVVIAGFGFMLSDRTTDAASTPSTAAPIAAAAPGADAVPAALLKPHPQKDLPPLELPAYPVGRSPEVITAAYKFAAEHPEVLSFVPCFCGCERSGHRGN